MRTAILAGAAVAALSFSGVALAAPASVTVNVGPELQEKADKYGQRDLDLLTRDLQRTVSHRLARSGAYDDARIELTLVDAKPNRPTFEEMGASLGLSPLSFGIGGAEIVGRAIRPDGVETPIGYKWYETDIRQAPYRSTWGDAQIVFERFAYRLAKGDQVAMR
ncbi:hypothetical protein [Phenylobacterium immobile]|uniref:hypothetical protein n=1 Tax=Phenylobacterium immobile TaxID=21 RepID=UPI000AFE44D4|nr:hypothetical protein [Phenylobacterium immobile]